MYTTCIQKNAVAMGAVTTYIIYNKRIFIIILYRMMYKYITFIKKKKKKCLINLIFYFSVFGQKKISSVIRNIFVKRTVYFGINILHSPRGSSKLSAITLYTQNVIIFMAWSWRWPGSAVSLISCSRGIRIFSWKKSHVNLHCSKLDTIVCLFRYFLYCIQ